MKFNPFQDHNCIKLSKISHNKTIFGRTVKFNLSRTIFITFNHKYGIKVICPHWEAPKFSFNAPNQADAWKSFYTQGLDFLQALDIDPDVEDQGKRGWRQIKMMFKDEDCLALQTLTDNQTITPAAQQTPSLALKVIQLVIKEDVHFWHQR